MKARKLIDIILIIIFLCIVQLMIAICVPACRQAKKQSSKLECKGTIGTLNRGCLTYRENFKRWPDKQKWSDSIKPYVGNSTQFKCATDKIGPCSYAMNASIPDNASELPDDMVLLFEGAPGWNNVGGPEDVVTDRHGKTGANIAFADGRVEFIEAEDIPKLRWTLEEKNENQN